MISKANATKILNVTLATGADFGELFFEDTTSTNMRLENGEVSKVSSGNEYGCGIRILKNDKCVYGYTNDLSMKSLMKLANTLKDRFDGTKICEVKPLKEVKVKAKHVAKIPYDTVSIEEQLNYLKKGYRAAKNYDSAIDKVDINFSTSNQKVVIFNTDGKIVKDTRCRGRLYLTAIAKKNDQMQANGVGPGAQKGFEFFKEEVDIEAIAKDCARAAITMLNAEECPSKVMPVILDNGFGGVIFHESCGHPLEASAVSKNLSIFSNKLGQKIASDIVTAIDDGTIDGGWGSANFDDEGNPTYRNVLIKDGILQNYLIDNFNGRAMNRQGNGACRRESYKNEPTSRMSNTFIDNGQSTFDEIIANTKYGLYAKSLGGGSVNPATGDFNFSVSEGYIVENGKITKPVKGATLIGNGANVLLKIDMVANNLLRAQGICGASSGNIPVDVGQPTLRVSSMTVGGRGGN